MHSRIAPFTRRAFLAAGAAVIPAAARSKNKLHMDDTKGEKVTVTYGDQPILEYRYTPARPKTYVHPLYTPNGFVVSSDSPPDHPHHQGLMLAWSNVNGVDFWGEKNPGKHGSIVNQRWLRMEATKPAVTLSTINHWEVDGKVWLVEHRTVRVPPPDPGVISFDWESEITAPGQSMMFDASQHPYNGLGVRFAPSMSFGGCLNSNGTTEIKKTNGEAANWCAYYGSMGDGRGPAGLAICDDPHNPRHPTPFFVMNDKFGYLSAAPTFHEPIELKPKEKLSFRWGVITFVGEPEHAKIDAWYKSWVSKKE